MTANFDGVDILFIDNFDSFTFNLVDELESRGASVEVWRNDVPVDRMEQMAYGLSEPALAMISPGPGTPADAGGSVEFLERVISNIPVFGICLGCQALVEAFGGRVGGAGDIVHGKQSMMEHESTPLFHGVENPTPVARYHSLCAASIPPEFEVTARCGDVPMAIEHTQYRAAGVQFHPESILTPRGGRIIDNLAEWID